ncbi:MAG TPA: hypothetical protein VHZ95_19435, partial [Polyangiales bacterium]|nr:hypothetical protein [Polyangiales bacterium]
ASCKRSGSPPPIEPTNRCEPERFAGFASPADAYARYAHGINEHAWCDGITTFAPPSRPAVLIANFKGLCSLAGARGPKQTQYREHLQAFCRKQALDCASEARVTAAILDVTNGEDLDRGLPALQQNANKTPESMYIDLMTELTAVDAALLSPFELPLRDVVVTGDRASGTAPQRDGSHRKLAFVKQPKGWLLSYE